MALQGWTVKEVSRQYIRSFIEKNHYSGNINGCISDFCFALYSPDDDNNPLSLEKVLMGGMFYGRMAMANQYKRFSDNENDVIELRRLCCIDDTPKNAESFFIGKSLRLLKKIWGSGIVVSYADKEHGHTGTIYKASNFKMIGEIPGSDVIIYKGKSYHDKTIRTKYNGELKWYSKKIKAALKSGEAYYKKTAGKYTYVYQL